MNISSLEELIIQFKTYDIDEEEINLVTKAYKYASFYHEGQKRDSGEAYIVHPLNVAYILSLYHFGTNMICAALLHDTLEDTKATKEDLAHDFNEDIANLVYGVTKRKDCYSTDEEIDLANIRKIMMGTTEDVRIIFIKIADRLHNMRTLGYKTQSKQKENALETMRIYVPFSGQIGANEIRNELAELSLKYLEPGMYEDICATRIELEEICKTLLVEMAYKIKIIFDNKNIPSNVKMRVKAVYGIYRKLREGKTLEDIRDLLAIKILVNNIENCYNSLGKVHGMFNYIEDDVKDTISKKGLYHSLDTSLFASDGRLVRAKIRTYEMDMVDANGFFTLWDINNSDERSQLLQTYFSELPICQSLKDINAGNPDDRQFFQSVTKELLSEKVIVSTQSGIDIELPKESTIIDFAFKVYGQKALKLVRAIVNGIDVDPNYVLKNKDKVKLIIDELSDGIFEGSDLPSKSSNPQLLFTQQKKPTNC